ncbi:MAG: cupredoxin domain-containing protein [Candidatus Promineifilaceae bacterium]
MQVTTQVPEKENSWLNNLALLGGVVVGVLLFGLVVARMGLLNGLLGRGATAVSPTAIPYIAENMRFGQEVVRVRAGEPVTFALANKDMYAHSFDVDELGWHVEMPANDQVIVDFTAVSPGSYTLYCAIPGHREAGMAATLIVEE